MPRSARYILAVAGVLGVACQNNTTNPGSTLPAPQNLGYQLDPSGDPNTPAGILLVWNDLPSTYSSALASYGVYSRASTSGSFQLRGETSSNTFHDNGVPQLQYAVTAVDVNGGQSDLSTPITVDERLRLQAPDTLGSISLNQAIHLGWADNAAQDATFKWYRVYSASYNLDTGVCGAWSLEGETVSNEFLATLLANGAPLCFGVSAISKQGYESLWSPLRQDTPRPDARNVLVYAFEQQPAQAGFRFWNDANGNGVGDPGELGLVQDGTRTDIDFRIHQASDSTLWIVPEFAGDSMQLYRTQPIADLTSIDFAPAGGYTRNMYQAVPGYGYVFQRNEAGAYHYAALRVTAVSRQYVIFDWSVQTDPGNPELAPAKRPATSGQAVAAR
jgi:fibronectin type 3 domain-containing protein